MFGLSQGTSKARLARARAKLARNYAVKPDRQRSPTGSPGEAMPTKGSEGRDKTSVVEVRHLVLSPKKGRNERVALTSYENPTRRIADAARNVANE